jgi:hypothetical protein
MQRKYINEQYINVLPGIKLEKVQEEGKGWGVICRKRIEGNTDIGYYFGRMYKSLAEFELISGGAWRRDYLMTKHERGNGPTINADEGGNIFRYVNHSDTRYTKL